MNIVAFCRSIDPNGAERWIRYSAEAKDHEEAAVKAERNLRTYDLREILTVDADAIRTWDPSGGVTERK